MSDGLKWGDPPPARRQYDKRAAKWAAIAEDLKAHPGQWALIAEASDTSIAYEINAARLQYFQPKGQFRAVTRRNRVVDGKKIADIYACYVGGAS